MTTTANLDRAMAAALEYRSLARDGRWAEAQQVERTIDEAGSSSAAPWVGAPGRVDGYAMIVAARRAKVEG